MLGFLKSFASNIHYKYSVQSQKSFEINGWEVFDAKHKSTGELASVFVLSKKKIVEMVGQCGIRPRSPAAAEICEMLAKGVQQLTKLRHPSILKIVEPLEQNKSSMVFATERVTQTLEQSIELEDLHVIRGFTTIVQGLEFLHDQIGMCHLNVAPHSVFVDQQGDWKLAGLEFVASFSDYQAGGYQLPILDPRMPAWVHPTYDYLAPELVLNRTILPANDVWGLACLIYAVYTRKPPMQLRGRSSDYRDQLKKFLQSLQSSQVINKLPQSLHPYLQSLFCVEHDGRITLPVLETTNFFQNPLIKSLKAMDDFSAKPVEEKISFLKHFVELLPQFPKQMRTRKIVKFASTELTGPRDVATGKLLGDVLFHCSSDMSRLGFQEQVLPVFAKLVDYLPFQESVSENMEVISKNTNDKDFSKMVLPLILDALKHHDAQHTALQSRLLSSAAVYGDNLTVSKLEQQMFPSVIDCFAATPARGVKICATQCLSVLVGRNVSKQLVTDRLIPALQAMKTRDPLVVGAVASLWKDVCARLNNEQIFTLALPNLLELSLAKQLTVDQFKLIMAVVQEQVDHVSKEQIKLLLHNEPERGEDDWLYEPESTQSISQTVQKQKQPPVQSSNTNSAPAVTKHNPLPAPSIKPEPLPKTLDSMVAGQKVKEKHNSKPPVVSAFPALQPAKSGNSVVDSMPALIPAKSGNSEFGAMPAMVPTKSGANDLDSMPTLVPVKPKTDSLTQPEDDEFGSFVGSDSIQTESSLSKPQTMQNFDSLI